jgi:DNA repair protein RecO (recombination protein O)
MDYKYTGIILNKVDVGETDRIYTIYTLEAGKIRVLGKGVRKPNAKLAGNLEPITEAEIFLAKSRGMGKITGVINLDNFSEIKNSFEALEKVGQVFKIFNKIIIEQEQDCETFRNLESFLRNLNDLTEKKESFEKLDLLVAGFIFKLLSVMGYHLEVDRCVHCEQKLQLENNYFSAAKGGVLCANCHKFAQHRIKINVAAIKVIRIILKNKLDGLVRLQISKQDIRNLEAIIQESLNWI